MRPLLNPIRPYAWGSRTAIAALQGRPGPTVEPEAELWMGAHPAAPSTFDDGAGLTPDLFGAEVTARFGNRLPYLLKVLAAAEPLSLQAHPDADQAAEGYASGHPSYVDPHHKPELLVARSDFDALCGFRDPSLTAELLGSFGVPELAPVVEALRGGSLREAVRRILTWPGPDRADLVDQVTKAGASGPTPGHALAADLGRRYPGDVGVVVALLLNQVRLSPDEAVFMPAGNLHAYLHGVGIEIMAASDNVLRGGLTPKTVDVPELLRVLRYEVLADPVLRPTTVAPGILTWPTPVAEFALHKAVAPASLPGGGPRIVVAVEGSGQVSTGPSVLPLSAGQSVFVSPAEGAVTLTGTLVAFQASVP